MTTRSLLWLLMVVSWGELEAAELRASLVARYQSVFTARHHWEYSVERDISHLLRDTELYFSKNNITIEDDLQLHQLFRKLSVYWKFFHDNHQRGVIGHWNYYRLMFEAIRDVDPNNITFSKDETVPYYQLLVDGAQSHIWQALRSYYEYFPFLKWSFCQEIMESCPRQQPAEHWSSIEKLATSMNSDIDHLNGKIEMLNSLMQKGSRIDRQSAIRDYIQTYSELVARPYGMLLFLVADKQHLSMVSAPRLPLLPYSLKRFSYVDSELLQKVFQELQAMFSTRLSKINSLYDKNNKKLLIVFLIKHHQQSIAEFVVNYPQFSAIIDHYLELANEQFVSSTTGRSKNAGGAALISSAGAVFLVSSAVLSRDSWRLFTRPKLNILAKISLILGGIATYYMTCEPSLRSLCHRPAVVESSRLQRRLQELRWSLAMRQSNNLRYFLQELSRSENLKDLANYQKLSIAFYATLLAIRGITIIKPEDAPLRKIFRKLREPSGNLELPQHFFPEFIYRKEFDFHKIAKVMDDYPEPETLNLATRGRLINDLFSSYSPFGKEFNYEEITTQQVKELSDAGAQLAQRFSPTDDNIRRLYSGINSANFDQRPEIGKVRRDITNFLSKTKNYINKLFRIDQNESAIVSSL